MLTYEWTREPGGGKSLVTASLANQMAAQGYQVGILDGTAAVCAEPVIRWRKPVIGET